MQLQNIKNAEVLSRKIIAYRWQESHIIQTIEIKLNFRVVFFSKMSSINKAIELPTIFHISESTSDQNLGFFFAWYVALLRRIDMNTIV